MGTFLKFFGIFSAILTVAALFLAQPPPVSATCTCASQFCVEDVCGRTCYGLCTNYDEGKVCGYQGNGSCANPGCTVPSTCEPGNCCDPSNITASSGSYCSASCNGTCNYFDNENCAWTQASCNVPPASTIKGYKTLMPGNQSQTGTPPTNLPYNLGISADGNYNPQSGTYDPYSLTVASACSGAQGHNVFVPIPVSYSVGYTKCDSSQANCPGNETPPPGPLSVHSSIPTGAGDNSAGSGTISTILNVTTPSQNSYADLWLHYCNTWTNVGPCDSSPNSCGPGGQIQTDNCGNTRTIACTAVCSFFQTFAGDVTFKGNLSNSQQPSSNYISSK